MWILISAVVTASLLGSLHCVGMCGPLAIWASGAGEGHRSSQLAITSAMYHFGRLLTYALAGLLAGAAGNVLDLGGQSLGIQLFAARTVGMLMIAIGLAKLWKLLAGNGFGRATVDSRALPGLVQTPRVSRIAGVLVRLRPWVFRLPTPMRGLVTGLLTALLPCGWLYLFALLAAGTGSVVTGPIVMAAFWLGSVPALVALVSGTQLLAFRFRQAIPVATAVLLIVAGGYTAAGRGFANLHALSDIRPQGLVGDAADAAAEPAALAAEVAELVTTPLPCCIHEPDLAELSTENAGLGQQNANKQQVLPAADDATAEGHSL